MDDRVPRRIGRLRGILMILLGIWVALASQLGPAIDFGYTPDERWALTQGQLVLQILPATVAVTGGTIIVLTTRRMTGAFAGWSASVAGVWLIVGPVATASVDDGRFVGLPLGTDGTDGTTGKAILEELALFSGAGLLLVLLATSAATRFVVHALHDAHHATAERELRDLRREYRESRRAPRQGEHSVRESHRRYLNAGPQKLHGPAADTRPMGDVTLPHPLAPPEHLDDRVALLGADRDRSADAQR